MTPKDEEAAWLVAAFRWGHGWCPWCGSRLMLEGRCLDCQRPFPRQPRPRSEFVQEAPGAPETADAPEVAPEPTAPAPEA